MRKRIAIAGQTEEGLSLIPMLEMNPDIDVCAILCEEPDAVRAVLRRIQPGLDTRRHPRITADGESVLQTPGLVAIVDANPGEALRGVLAEAPERGIQVATPAIAKLLWAFGPVDATRKPDLLQTLAEILESYNLTVDRRGLLNRILQIAIGATGADRGSLMLVDSNDGALAVDVAVGIEKELMQKIRIRPGEGIAGKALEEKRSILLSGKADRERYNIARERDDVESALSVPLIHADEVIGVLNLSHARRRGAFSEEDVEFVEQLARIDAKIIARAEEYHTLVRDSKRLHAHTDLREILSASTPLHERLSQVCARAAEQLESGVCHLLAYDPDLAELTLRASSRGHSPLTPALRFRAEDGIHGRVLASRKPVLLSQQLDGAQVSFGVLPLIARGELLGVLSFEGVVHSVSSQAPWERISAFAQALGEELHGVLRELRVERAASQTAAIAKLASHLHGQRDSVQLYRDLTRSAATVLEAEHAVLRLQDGDSGRFQIRSYFGSAESESQARLFALEKRLCIEAITDRAAIRVADLHGYSEGAGEIPEVRSALVQPLEFEGRILGTFSVLGKLPENPLAGESFSKEDQQLLANLAEQAVRALIQIHGHDRSPERQPPDEATALPNAAHLRERLEQEVARCGHSGRRLALLTLELRGLAERLAASSPAARDQLLLAIAEELRAGLRPFDVLARTATDRFEILAPEPDVEIPVLLGALTRRLQDLFPRDSAGVADEPPRPVFGYALFPEDGRTASALIERASQPRVTTD